jgi:hypothetical protein
VTFHFKLCELSKNFDTSKAIQEGFLERMMTKGLLGHVRRVIIIYAPQDWDA